MYKIRLDRGQAEVKVRTALKNLCKAHKRTELSDKEVEALAEKLATKFDSQSQSLGAIGEVKEQISERFQEIVHPLHFQLSRVALEGPDNLAKLMEMEDSDNGEEEGNDEGWQEEERAVRRGERWSRARFELEDGQC
ncbi:hypothetical protein NCC49_003815 [Naganishia albida]|nr:hypothetical protein NCC49_003815 [Naganishia albida]